MPSSMFAHPRPLPPARLRIPGEAAVDAPRTSRKHGRCTSPDLSTGFVTKGERRKLRQKAKRLEGRARESTSLPRVPPPHPLMELSQQPPRRNKHERRLLTQQLASWHPHQRLSPDRPLHTRTFTTGAILNITIAMHFLRLVYQIINVSRYPRAER